jgi:hypothetical protein
MTRPKDHDWAAAGEPPEEVARVLEQRARALALEPETVTAPAAHDVMLLSLGGEWHAVEVGHVVEALAPSPPTPLPGTPAFVAGVISRRGRVVPVMDAGRLLGLPDTGAAERQVVVVAVAGMTFGIAVDDVEGPLPRDADERLVSALDLEELVEEGRVTIEEDG